MKHKNLLITLFLFVSIVSCCTVILFLSINKYKDNQTNPNGDNQKKMPNSLPINSTVEETIDKNNNYQSVTKRDSFVNIYEENYSFDLKFTFKAEKDVTISKSDSGYIIEGRNYKLHTGYAPEGGPAEANKDVTLINNPYNSTIYRLNTPPDAGQYSYYGSYDSVCVRNSTEKYAPCGASAFGFGPDGSGIGAYANCQTITANGLTECDKIIASLKVEWLNFKAF